LEFLKLKDFLDLKVAQYNRPDFITNDPVCIPHRFSKKQDVEIAAFFAAILAWGQRKTIINKCTELFERMDNEPYAFMLNHGIQDLKGLLGFKHRTFNDTDLLYFVAFFQQHYQQSDTLETAFLPGIIRPDLKLISENIEPVERTLNYFRSYFFSLPDFPIRTIKHVSSPKQKSTCKRLNMFLRWMVRKDNMGVDFGLWNHIKPSNLICPCDVHVDRVARRLNMITRKQTDWITAIELTTELRKLDPLDPVKYDFALFGLGVEEKF
jgi:uncharacterized protein (TIGR02757 family)